MLGVHGSMFRVTGRGIGIGAPFSARTSNCRLKVPSDVSRVFFDEESAESCPTAADRIRINSDDLLPP